ncbi:MAG: DNA internalization-related competence protein ComEC/Rec2 [Dehalococcoidales bacterium]|nr:DNA internalization-related competence protein ComEC/Rec2 [Dehalococcoidales bacterium]
MPLIYLSFAWIVGILFGERFSWPLALICVGFIPLVLLLFMPRHRKWLLLLGICLIAFFGGGLYTQYRLPSNGDNSLRFYNDKSAVEIEGMVSHDPEVGDKTIRLHLSVTNITGEGHEVSGNVLLFVPIYPTGTNVSSTYNYGDVLLVTGKLETPARLDGFDYQGYLANQGIYSIMYYPRIETLETGRGLTPLAWVYHLRGRLAEIMNRVLPEPQAALAQGIVLGMRGDIPPDVKDDFIHTGTAHLLVISGVNLSIMAGILVSLGIWLFGRRLYIYVWLALGMIWLYALLTGLEPPVVRAVIMASLFLIAELLGRQRSAGITLVFAAAVMVSITPRILHDASFQLSFMAMAGLIFVFPPLQSLGRKLVSSIAGDKEVIITAANTVVDSFGVSISAVIAVWPLIAYYFGIISWVGPVATLLTMFSMPGIIIFGSLAGVIGFFFLPLAQVIAWVAWLFLTYLFIVVKIFDLVPFGNIGPFDSKWIWIYYAALAIILWLGSNRQKFVASLSKVADFAAGLRMKWVVGGLLVAAVLVCVAVATMPDDNLHVTFLNVGQGDAILIQKGNRQVLVDGGPSPQAIALGLSREMPFWDRNIDLVISTHPHADHITGLLEVMNRYRVEQVLYPDSGNGSPLSGEWLRLITGKNIKSTIARSGQQINLGETVIEILNPPVPPLTDTESYIDNNAVVLRLKMGGVSFLLTADTMWEAETELIARRADLSSTVLKVGHHSSNTSTSAEFLAVVNPSVAVISVGAKNDFGHPNKEVMARLVGQVGQANIYRTDENGTIEFTTDGKKLWVKLEK